MAHNVRFATCLLGFIAISGIAGGEPAKSPEQPSEVAAALNNWEQKASETHAFHCHFTRLLYDPIFFPSCCDKQLQPVQISEGEILYAAPDRAVFRERNVRRMELNPATRDFHQRRVRSGLHWTLDGARLCHVDEEAKSVESFNLPSKVEAGWFFSLVPIDSDGKPRPLELIVPPFGFAISAKDLKGRFSIRLSESRDASHGTWLEFKPTSPSDQRRFSSVDIIFGENRMPSAIQMTAVNGSDREVLLFDGEECDPKESPAADAFSPHPSGYKQINNW